jgi:hypothetical protein
LFVVSAVVDQNGNRTGYTEGIERIGSFSEVSKISNRTTKCILTTERQPDAKYLTSIVEVIAIDYSNW